jgi:hypothetical protein
LLAVLRVAGLVVMQRKMSCRDRFCGDCVERVKPLK